MGVSAHVGRIGALAVALGVGVAVATGGQGVAWADSPSSASGSASSAPDSASKEPTAKRTGTVRSTKPNLGPRTASAARVGTRSAGDDTEPAGTGADSPGAPKPRPKPRVVQRVVDALTGTDTATAKPDGKPAGQSRSRLDDGSPRNSGGTAAGAQTAQATQTSQKPAPLRVRSALPEPASAGTVAGVVNDVLGAGGKPLRRATPALDSVRAALDSLPKPDLPAAAKATEILVAQVTPVALTASRPVPKLVSRVLATVGLTPLATGTPVTPGEPPAALALLAWARREFERSTLGTGVATSSGAGATPVATALAADVTPTAAVTAAPVVGSTRQVGWITGPLGTNNTPARFNIGGTDLGIMWDDGDGHVLTIFGDTFREPAMTNDWRFNVLLRSTDGNLSNGMTFDDALIAGNAGKVFGQGQAITAIDDPGFLGLVGSRTTIIPTAAISVTDDKGNTTQYVNFMSVRTWDTPGRWTTNYSAIASSTDGGKTWTVDPDTVRSSGWLRASKPYQPGNQNFQQGAYTYGNPDDPTSFNQDGVAYVFSYGTPSGRGGSAYLSRVPEDEILEQGEYEYWNGSTWIKGDPSAAVPVIGATDQPAPLPGVLGWIQKIVNDFLGGIVVGGLTGGNVSEMSVQYNPYLDKYVVLYTNASNNVVMRTADSPQGQWSDPTTLATSGAYPGLYAPMIHPWSGTAAAGAGNEQYLYWNLSQWTPYYNVELMETDLQPTKQQLQANVIAV